MMTLLSTIVTSAKTLVVYYSFTNNVHTIVSDLNTQIDADVIRIEPAEKGIDYAANNYAAGSALISAIRNNPDDASSYPAIDPVDMNMADYDMVIVAAPLWWSQMAAPMQTFLFNYGSQMAGKSIALIVSSASSGISGVAADAKRLIPNGNFIEPNLWIRSSQTSNCHSLIAQWLTDINYSTIAGISPTGNGAMNQIEIADNKISVRGSFDELTVLNASGQNILHTSAPFSDFPFPHGIYFAILRNGNRLKSAKIINR